MVFFLLVGCSSIKDVNRDPDFQSRLMPYYNGFGNEEEQIRLAMVNDNMTKEDRQLFRLPEEWEVYRIKLADNTRFIDENGNVITKEMFATHEYEHKVWTKENFKPKWSKALTEATGYLKIDHLPIYTATQIQMVQMTDEEYLARDYADKEGDYALQIYLGELWMNSNITQEVQNQIDMQKYNINTVGYSRKPSERKEKLLEIEEYPIFILYDHEKVLLKTTELQDISSFLAHENE